MKNHDEEDRENKLIPIAAALLVWVAGLFILIELL